jgi:flagellar biosynthetic protein FlhB
MSMERYPDVFAEMYNLLLDGAWIFLGWAGIDYVMEWRSRESRLRMSKQDMRDEYREMEGSPQVKSRIRGLRRQMRRRQLKADIGRASVVVTNPTHYAVALTFNFETMEPPRVLAKGRDLLAAQIREEAQWAGVPIVENPPLARSLYRQVEQGQTIPYELYAAVAAILAWLYRREVEERVRRERADAQARAKKNHGGGPREAR